MIKTKLKFALSADFLLISGVFVIFFDDHLDILINYIFPVIFIYFVIDSLVVIIPNINKYLPAMKHFSSYYQERPNYDKNILGKISIKNNKKAFFTFILYFGAITILGLIYLSFDNFEEIHIYLLFLFINLMDYFCILIWCPFKNLIFKNSCCYTCRITNWDRLMKFSILIFVPNFFTITLFVLGILIFLMWEFSHHLHPERFYSISNNALRCTSCIETSCKKKKE